MPRPKDPTYKRQKWLLLLLKESGGKLSRVDFQKLLFLLSEEQDEPYFDFVPYRYGCYSYQAMADLDTLAHQGWLSLGPSNIRLNPNVRVRSGLPAHDVRQLVDTLAQYKGLRGTKLIRHIYEHYPYFAINSEIVERVLDPAGLKVVRREKRKTKLKDPVVYTIGYEGLKFETYLNRLIQNGIRLLVDVRQNPLSRKYGFSKNTLAGILPKLDIAYAHVPELGIMSAKRKGLSTSDDFRQLFKEYRRDLPKRKQALRELDELIAQHHRVALTCFEAHHTDCHRHCISDLLATKKNQKVVHL